MFIKTKEIRPNFNMMSLTEILTRRTASNNLLSDKAFYIDKNPKYDKYQHGIESMVYKLFGFYEFFYINSAATHKEKGIYSDVVSENQKLIEDLQKPIIRKFEKQNVHLSFKDNFWGVDLADFVWISRYNKRFQFLLFAIDIFSKYAWGFLLKTKKILQLPILF